MVIERNEAWGEPGVLEPDAPIARSDADAAALYDRGVTAMRLASGDLARTLGIDGRLDRPPSGMLLPIDAMAVEIDGEPAGNAVAHLVVGRLWSRKPFVAVMNAAYIGEWNLAPRAHPGDGSFDVVDVALGWRDRVRAKRRAVTGAHVPHPDINVRRQTDWSLDCGDTVAVHRDGVRVGTGRHIRCTIRPEAITIGI